MRASWCEWHSSHFTAAQSSSTTLFAISIFGAFSLCRPGLSTFERSATFRGGASATLPGSWRAKLSAFREAGAGEEWPSSPALLERSDTLRAPSTFAPPASTFRAPAAGRSSRSLLIPEAGPLASRSRDRPVESRSRPRNGSYFASRLLPPADCPAVSGVLTFAAVSTLRDGSDFAGRVGDLPPAEETGFKRCDVAHEAEPCHTSTRAMLCKLGGV